MIILQLSQFGANSSVFKPCGMGYLSGHFAPHYIFIVGVYYMFKYYFQEEFSRGSRSGNGDLCGIQDVVPCRGTLIGIVFSLISSSLLNVFCISGVAICL